MLFCRLYQAIFFTVFFRSELNFNGKELAVFFKNAFQAELIQELFPFLVDMKDHIGSPLFLWKRGKLKFR